MKIWLDEMLPRRLCGSIEEWTGIEAYHVGSAYREDLEIFQAARAADAIVLTKDSDFVVLVNRLGAPPRVIWLRYGNCSSRALETMLKDSIGEAIELVNRGEPVVEIRRMAR